MDLFILFACSIGAGFLGALLGLGGGIIVVPVLTLVFHVDIRYAIAASLISIVATSSGAAASFLRDHLTNLRLVSNCVFANGDFSGSNLTGANLARADLTGALVLTSEQQASAASLEGATLPGGQSRQ